MNEAAEQSTVKPMVNMGQGFFGYNVSRSLFRSVGEASFADQVGRLREFVS